MTVRELINILNSIPEDTEVRMIDTRSLCGTEHIHYNLVEDDLTSLFYKAEDKVLLLSALERKGIVEWGWGDNIKSYTDVEIK
jgi:hypothetical protein